MPSKIGAIEPSTDGQFKYANAFKAQASTDWLSLYWSGVDLHLKRGLHRLGRIYLTTDDDFVVYDVHKGQPPHFVDTKCVRLVRQRDGIYRRVIYPGQFGYHIRSVISFTWTNLDDSGCVAYLKATRIGNKNRWWLVYMSNHRENDLGHGEHQEALKRFFMAIMPGTLKIVRLDNAMGASLAAKDAACLTPYNGNQPVGYDNRPYRKIAEYCERRSIEYVHREQPDDQRIWRKLPNDFHALCASA